VDPQPRGPDWMQITPKAGFLFHANSHMMLFFLVYCEKREVGPVHGSFTADLLLLQCNTILMRCNKGES
jgi:hypothetical protein